ncbi:hypothetical protein AVEN_111229-1 [Araneus ventricosus]|uniref:Histone-lysine N-methyltransferase SETMAR n=1 Tax=Araneus ventricosus TaxID=182803 RepID=A0A4Y2EM32_ARAVE|nr:hypothetical protein AVEN_111229-1 [Araneus ventricosus]
MLKQVYVDDIIALKTVCCQVLKRLLTRIRRVRLHLKLPGSWIIFHGNARPHTAMPVKRFLAQHGVTELSHPPYFPNHSPPGFFLFPKLKVALKPRRFTDITHIEVAVARKLNAIQVDEFQELSTICTHVIKVA